MSSDPVVWSCCGGVLDEDLFSGSDEVLGAPRRAIEESIVSISSSSSESEESDDDLGVVRMLDKEAVPLVPVPAPGHSNPDWKAVLFILYSLYKYRWQRRCARPERNFRNHCGESGIVV